MVDFKTIQEVAGLIAERFKPERVILFGSYARGQAHENSDVDLLVEFPSDQQPQQPGNPVRRAIAERFVLPVDVIIRTTDSVRKFRDDPYSLVYHAIRDGVVLYDRHAA